MQNHENMISLTEKVLNSGNTASLQVGSIGLNGIELEYVGRDREFDPLITDSYLPLPDYKARCHSISYYTICDGIIYPINKFPEKYDINEVKIYLEGLRDAVFPLGIAALAEPYKSLFKGATGAIEAILRELGKAEIIMVNLAFHANQLLNGLNNSPQNLRAGWGSWNSSVQTAFDPETWCYVQNHKAISSQENLHIDLPFPGDIGDGFYLNHPTDGIRLCHIFDRTRGNPGRFSIYQAKTRTPGDHRPFLFSSSNAFKLPLYLDFKKNVPKLYFWDSSRPQGWREFQV